MTPQYPRRKLFFILIQQYLKQCFTNLPSSAFSSHSTNFLVCSKNTLFPLEEWASLYHFKITISDNTSAKMKKWMLANYFIWWMKWPRSVKKTLQTLWKIIRLRQTTEPIHTVVAYRLYYSKNQGCDWQ